MKKILLTYRQLVKKEDASSVVISGGAQKVLFHLLTGLKNTGNYDVYLATADSGDSLVVKTLEEYGIHHIETHFEKVFNLFEFVSFYRALKKNGIEIINSHDRKSTFFSFFASKLLNIKYVFTCHSMFPDQKFTRWFFGKRLTAVSKSVKKNLVERFRIKGDCIRVIYNGLDLKEPTEDEINAAKELVAFNPSYFYLLVCSRLDKVKRIDMVLSALGQLHDEKIKFLIVGDGAEMASLKKMTKDLQLEKQVIFTGYQQNPLPFYKISNVYMLTSKFEGFSLCALEAKFFSLPVIASDIEICREIIVDGESGLLFQTNSVDELAGKIRRLADDREKAFMMGRYAAETVKKEFSLAKMVERYDDYFCEVLSDRK